MRGGMPAGKSQLDRLRKRFDPLRERMDLFISGRAPSDPFYLTNRTWRQKLKIASLIAAPVLLLIALVTIGATGRFRFHKVDPDERPPAEAPAPAEAPPPAAPQKPLPDPISTRTCQTGCSAVQNWMLRCQCLISEIHELEVL